MPLLSTRMSPSLVLASETVALLGAGGGLVDAVVVVVVDGLVLVLELAGLLLLEHAANANAATAASATNRIPDVRMRTSSGLDSSHVYGRRVRVVHSELRARCTRTLRT